MSDDGWESPEERPPPRPARQRYRDQKPKKSKGYSTMEVPIDKVDKVIGRDGRTIQKIIDITGVGIFLSEDHTKMKLFGDANTTNHAKRLIHDIIDGVNQESEEDEQKAPGSPRSWKERDASYERRRREMWAKEEAIVKHFYDEDPDISFLSASEVENIRASKFQITVLRVFADEVGFQPIPNPILKFGQCFRGYPQIMSMLRRQNFKEPSPIQCQAWPVLLSGEDLIGIAQTGTGKTLAFLLPALIHIDGQTTPWRERKGPTVLVLAPTRELARQIQKEVEKYPYNGINAGNSVLSVCIYGGASRTEQIQNISDGVAIVIATPGRLNDLIMKKHINLSTVTYLVLDEADRMLDMGFEPQIRKSLFDVRPDRQTVMTSATWPQGVRRLAKSYMNNPVHVSVGSLDLAAVHTVHQTVLMVPDDVFAKFDTFLEWARRIRRMDKVIVFCGRKSVADYVASELALNHIEYEIMHGDIEQESREEALDNFAGGVSQILITTDLASRGLDIANITHVINFDFPRNIEEYVHRIGRTGRAGKTGESITYFTRADWAHAAELIKILAEANQEIPDELRNMARRFEAAKSRRSSGPKRGGQDHS